MKAALRAILVGSLLGAWCSAYAWIDTGHMVIASIAQSNLDAKARSEAERLLKIGATGTATDFIAVASWADETRTRENGPWHYEDHHFRVDGRRVTNRSDSQNVVWAIDRFTKILADKTRPDADRAEALRYLIHFVGDAHQPLHATALDADAYPRGDRGGNEYHIQAPRTFSRLMRPPNNLHSLWDMGCGLFMPDSNLRSADGQQHVKELAAWIEKQCPKKSLPEEKERDPEHWTLESFQVAKNFVYSTPENGEPNAVYLMKGQKVAARQAALAGYRLADLLNRILG